MRAPKKQPPRVRKLSAGRHVRRHRKPHEPPTAGGRELRLAARPPARFSSLRNPEIVNQKQRPLGNTLLAQRCPRSGNSYFWRTARLSILGVRRLGAEEVGRISVRTCNSPGSYPRRMAFLLPLTWSKPRPAHRPTSHAITGEGAHFVPGALGSRPFRLTQAFARHRVAAIANRGWRLL